MPIQHTTQHLEVPPLHPIPIQSYIDDDAEDAEDEEHLSFSSSLHPSPPDVLVIPTAYNLSLKANQQTGYRALNGLERFKYTERLRKLSESSTIPRDLPEFQDLVSTNTSSLP